MLAEDFGTESLAITLLVLANCTRLTGIEHDDENDDVTS